MEDGAKRDRGCRCGVGRRPGMPGRTRRGESGGATTEAGAGPPRWSLGGSERKFVVGAEQIELGIGVGVERRID